jgi:hypothetical protein
MMHFFAKFFTFHKVRWDDAPNLRGGELERGLKPLLEQRINWAAPHMQNLSRWTDVATGDMGTSIAPRVVRKGGE